MQTNEQARQAAQQDIMYARIEVLTFNAIMIFFYTVFTMIFYIATESIFASVNIFMALTIVLIIINTASFIPQWKVALSDAPEKTVN